LDIGDLFLAPLKPQIDLSCQPLKLSQGITSNNKKKIPTWPQK